MKKFLTLAVAVCMLVAVVLPAGAAVDTTPTLERPGSNPAPVIDAADVPMTMSDDVVELRSVSDFDRSDWMQGKTYELMADVDLSSLYAGKGDWVPLINGFKGTFNGNGNTISGVPNNCYLMDYTAGGTIENLIFDVGNKAAFLVFGPVDTTGTAMALSMKNITVKGNVKLTSANQSNYSPFIYAASPGFVMENCVNYADISGVTYASVFYGYTPYLGGAHTFRNCVNHGNVELSNGALFFGNPTAFNNGSAVLSTIHVTIENCANYGQIRSLATPAYYFAADVGGGLSTYSQGMEDLLTDNSSMLATGNLCTDANCPHHGEIDHDGKLYTGAFPAGMGIGLDDDGETLVITRATDETDIAYYDVALSSYVAVFETNSATAMGSEQEVISERIRRPDSDGATIQANIKYYGYADEGAYAQTGTVNGYPVTAIDGKTYYLLGHRTSITYPSGDGTNYQVYVSGASFQNGEFVGSVSGPGTAYVAAYDKRANLLGIVYLR